MGNTSSRRDSIFAASPDFPSLLLEPWRSERVLELDKYGGDQEAEIESCLM